MVGAPACSPRGGGQHGGRAGAHRCLSTVPSRPPQMLVVFKSAPILKRALKVKQAMLQLYVLKLLKVQTKYLGRQWRKSNMKTMSAIYQKVRHRLNDDWAYGNGKALARSRRGAFPSEEPAESSSCFCRIRVGAPGGTSRNCLGLAHVVTPYSSVP